MYNYDEELYILSFTDEEMEKLINKFNKENMKVFDLIIYFSSFEPNIKELVERVKKIKEKVYNSKNITPKEKIENEINRLSTKELDFIIALLNESEFCASSDDRYIVEARYLDYLKTISEKASSRKLHNKQKIRI